MKRIIQLSKIITAIMAFCLVGCTAQTPVDDLHAVISGTTVDLSHLTVPVFPDYSVSIEDFGAVGDGKTLNTV